MGSSGKFILMDNIDLSGVTWTGKTLNSGAEFNGNGYTISNLTGSQGLFSTSSGTVKNVTLTDVAINCGGNVGGIIGVNNGSLENSYVSASITANGTVVGGAVGLNNAKIKNVVAIVDVTSSTFGVGGLAGNNLGGSIENCSASGKVTGTFATGGFVGWQSGGTIDNSKANVEVVATNYEGGGFVGSLDGGTIKNSYATGNVKCNDSRAAGFVAKTGGGSAVNCYSTGIVTSTATDAGAFIGRNATTSKNCIANAEQPSNIKTTQTGVTCLALEEMKNIDYYLAAGWDISEYDAQNQPTTTWFIKDGELPQLAWEWEATEPESESISLDFQIGSNSGEKNMLHVELGFSLGGFNADVTTQESAADTLDVVDALKKDLTKKRAEIGVYRNRIEGVLNSQSIKIENLSASHSTVVDTDFAKESAALVKSQILQSAASSLLKQANFAPNIALKLLT